MLTLLAGLIAVSSLSGQTAFRVDAGYVRVPVTVLDQDGRSILGLTGEDFRLFDEEKEMPISNFLLDPAPVNVIFLLDTSGSVKEELQQIRYAVIRFAQHFDKDDRMEIVSFSDRMQTLQSWTNDPGDIRKSVRRLEQGYRTALYDSLVATASEKFKGIPGKRVILLLTDGLDNESETSYEEAMNRLIDLDVVLYIVSRTRLVQSKVEKSERVEFLDKVLKNVLNDDNSFVEAYFREKETSMNYLAEVNAGRVLYPLKLEELGQAYVRIAQELKTQYLLTFLPAATEEPEYRNLRVECLRPVGEVFHRKMYRTR
jgi:VWFA-related protein